MFHHRCSHPLPLTSKRSLTLVFQSLLKYDLLLLQLGSDQRRLTLCRRTPAYPEYQKYRMVSGQQRTGSARFPEPPTFLSGPVSTEPHKVG
ncbi:unnamed protein product [Haemonchus placei]|uniref:Secreted protein n=1 Tax=Haemonchus placei TaxID=6290 RepID=A0A0N4WUF0_HAEPC|nr:unnamed protein product [Haemonchus placei]